LYERIEEWKVLFIGMILLCFEVTLEKGNWWDGEEGIGNVLDLVAMNWLIFWNWYYVMSWFINRWKWWKRGGRVCRWIRGVFRVGMWWVILWSMFYGLIHIFCDCQNSL
jgi:hypothetical protein